ncbi:MAG: 3-dehydroquinate synthase family protein [Bacteroidota bacterium]
MTNQGQLLFSENIYADFQEYCKRNNYQHIIFLCDENTSKYCVRFFDAVNLITIPAGEQYKNSNSYAYIVEQLLKFKTGKQSLMVNLGGGVVTDIGGYAASTFMRGIPFVNIPTTLVGMADAAIGGKTGIDFNSYKNYLGTFAQPQKIFISTVFLKTLPELEMVCGYAEIIKTGVIANAELFQLVANNADIDQLIQLTATTKLNIIEKDFYDKGERQLLNFGHTLGHAFESFRLSAGNPILHGLAVAKGMLAELRIAQALQLIDAVTVQIITEVIVNKTAQQEFSIIEFEELKPFLFADKKNENGTILLSLPTGIGSGRIKVPADLALIQHSLFNAQNS